MSKIHKALQKAELEGRGFAAVVTGPRLDTGGAHLDGLLPQIDVGGLGRAPFTRTASKFVEIPHAVSEDFLSLHNRLELQPSATRHRSLLVTSALPGEGSSIVALQLAASMARKVGRSVLLVDGDLRTPNLDHFFELDGRPGFLEVLGGAAAAEKAIQATELERLYLLSAGKRPEPATPLDMVQDTLRMRNFGSFLKQQFNYVVIDASPVLGNSDVQVLAAAADGVILVVKAHKTRRQVLQEAKRLLERSGAKVIGVVLNRRRFPIPDWIYRRV